jgi:hypothetical protein
LKRRPILGPFISAPGDDYDDGAGGGVHDDDGAVDGIRFVGRNEGPPLWSSSQEFLATDPEPRVRFPAL